MGLDTMTSLLELELENEKIRYNALLNTGRKDAVAQIVLNRIKKEIKHLEKKVSNEEKPRKEITTRTNTGRITRYIEQVMHRYWPKCYGDNRAIPSIPAIKTL